MPPAGRPSTCGRAGRRPYERALPAQILDRLSQRLDLLKGGRDADPRQQTLRTTIEWSYELLTLEEQQLFARLSVFAGGCTLEAAEEVADADLDTMQSLVEKSLLRFTAERYWMLETIREYAGERLASEDALGVAQRHLRRFLDLAESAEPDLWAQRTDAWLPRLDAEDANFRAALGWAIAREDAEVAVRLATALAPFWEIRARHGEARVWLEQALDLRSGVAPSLRAKALVAAGRITAWRFGWPAAVGLLTEAVEALTGPRRRCGSSPLPRFHRPWAPLCGGSGQSGCGARRGRRARSEHR